MRKIRIYAGISGVIPNGSYQNLKPTLLWEEEIDDCQMTDIEIEDRQKDLYAKCYKQFADIEVQAVVDRIKKERADFRFAQSPKTGKTYPSVTSIINYDADFFVSDMELKQYAAQGNITHARVEHFIKTGEWIEGIKIQDVWTDMVILKNGSLNLPANVGDFPAFLLKFPIKDMKVAEKVWNDKDEYHGTPDFYGVPDFNGKVLTVFDAKRTVDPYKHGMQVAAYAKPKGITQAILVPLNGKTKQGYSKPVIYDKDKLEGFYKMFLRKRNEFKKRYDI